MMIFCATGRLTISWRSWRRQVKLMKFALKMIDFALKMVDFALKMMYFVLKMRYMHFVLKLMYLEPRRVGRWQRRAEITRGWFGCENDEFCIKNEKVCTETRNCVSKTGNFALKMMNLSGGGEDWFRSEKRHLKCKIRHFKCRIHRFKYKTHRIHHFLMQNSFTSLNAVWISGWEMADVMYWSEEWWCLIRGCVQSELIRREGWWAKMMNVVFVFKTGNRVSKTRNFVLENDEFCS